MIRHVVTHYRHLENFSLVMQNSDDFSCDGYDVVEEHKEYCDRWGYHLTLSSMLRPLERAFGGSDEVVEFAARLAPKIMRRVGHTI
jgi:hypothetical protein